MKSRSAARHLSFESLESRSLLAVGAFTVNLYQDVGGSPGPLITNDQIQAGQAFFVEIMARELHPLRSGFAAVSLDIEWNPRVLEEIDQPFDPAKLITSNLPLARGGTLDNRKGAIDDLTGLAVLSSNLGRAIGNTVPERFAMLHFRAEQSGESFFTMRQGSSRIATVPVSSLGDANLYYEPQMITVLAGNAGAITASQFSTITQSVPLAASVPKIEVTSSSGASLKSVEFTTEVVVSGTQTTLSPLVRPDCPDSKQFVEVTNTGTSPLTISEIQVNVPDVTVVPNLTSSAADDLVLAVGQKQKFQLKYAPRTPNATIAALQSFDAAKGLVIKSNATDSPELAIELVGASTYNADVNYDGRVDQSDTQFVGTFSNSCPTSGNQRESQNANGEGTIAQRDGGVLAAQYNRTRSAVEMKRLAIASVSRTLALDTALSQLRVDSLLPHDCDETIRILAIARTKS